MQNQLQTMAMYIYLRFDYMLCITEVNSPENAQLKKNFPACKELNKHLVMSILKNQLIKKLFQELT